MLEIVKINVNRNSHRLSDEAENLYNASSQAWRNGKSKESAELLLRASQIARNDLHRNALTRKEQK